MGALHRLVVMCRLRTALSRAVVAWIAVGLLVTACGAPAAPSLSSGELAPSSRPRTKIRSEREVAMPCPLGVPGATIYAEDTLDGIDVSLTSFDRTAELRERAANLTRQHGPLRHEGLGHDGQHGQGHRHGLELFALPPIRVTVEDIPLGARLHIVPEREAQVGRVRSGVRERVVRVASIPCEVP